MPYSDKKHYLGRMIEEDGTIINVANILDEVNDREEIITTTLPFLAIKNGFSFGSGKLYEDVAADGLAIMHFKSGSKFCFLQYTVSSTGHMHFGMHDGMVITGNGTAHYITPRNLMQSETVQSSVYYAPTYSDIGTRLIERMSAIGDGPAKGGSAEGDVLAVVIPPNHSVFVVAQNKSTTQSDVNIIMNWFEKDVFEN